MASSPSPSPEETGNREARAPSPPPSPKPAPPLLSTDTPTNNENNSNNEAPFDVMEHCEGIQILLLDLLAAAVSQNESKLDLRFFSSPWSSTQSKMLPVRDLIVRFAGVLTKTFPNNGTNLNSDVAVFSDQMLLSMFISQIAGVLSNPYFLEADSRAAVMKELEGWTLKWLKSLFGLWGMKFIHFHTINTHSPNNKRSSMNYHDYYSLIFRSAHHKVQPFTSKECKSFVYYIPFDENFDNMEEMVYLHRQQFLTTPYGAALMRNNTSSLFEIRAVPSLPNSERMDTAALETFIQEDLEAGKRPVFVLARAGTPVTGEIDDLKAIRRIIDDCHAFMHVEGDALVYLIRSANKKPDSPEPASPTSAANARKSLFGSLLTTSIFSRITTPATTSSSARESFAEDGPADKREVLVHATAYESLEAVDDSDSVTVEFGKYVGVTGMPAVTFFNTLYSSNDPTGGSVSPQNHTLSVLSPNTPALATTLRAQITERGTLLTSPSSPTPPQHQQQQLSPTQRPVLRHRISSNGSGFPNLSESMTASFSKPPRAPLLKRRSSGGHHATTFHIAPAPASSSSPQSSSVSTTTTSTPAPSFFTHEKLFGRLMAILPYWVFGQSLFIGLLRSSGNSSNGSFQDVSRSIADILTSSRNNLSTGSNNALANPTQSWNAKMVNMVEETVAIWRDVVPSMVSQIRENVGNKFACLEVLDGCVGYTLCVRFRLSNENDNGEEKAKVENDSKRQKSWLKLTGDALSDFATKYLYTHLPKQLLQELGLALELVSVSNKVFIRFDVLQAMTSSVSSSTTPGFVGSNGTMTLGLFLDYLSTQSTILASAYTNWRLLDAEFAKRSRECRFIEDWFVTAAPLDTIELNQNQGHGGMEEVMMASLGAIRYIPAILDTSPLSAPLVPVVTHPKHHQSNATVQSPVFAKSMVSLIESTKTVVKPLEPEVLDALDVLHGSLIEDLDEKFALDGFCRGAYSRDNEDTGVGGEHAEKDENHDDFRRSSMTSNRVRLSLDVQELRHWGLWNGDVVVRILVGSTHIWTPEYISQIVETVLKKVHDLEREKAFMMPIENLLRKGIQEAQAKLGNHQGSDGGGSGGNGGGILGSLPIVGRWWSGDSGTSSNTQQQQGHGIPGLVSDKRVQAFSIATGLTDVPVVDGSTLMMEGDDNECVSEGKVSIQDETTKSGFRR